MGLHGTHVNHLGTMQCQSENSGRRKTKSVLYCGDVLLVGRRCKAKCTGVATRYTLRACHRHVVGGKPECAIPASGLLSTCECSLQCLLSCMHGAAVATHGAAQLVRRALQCSWHKDSAWLLNRAGSTFKHICYYAHKRRQLPLRSTAADALISDHLQLL